jgi:hypothetical protein
MEQEEVFETPSQDTEIPLEDQYDFLPQEEAAPDNAPKKQEEVTFREPTEEELPRERVARSDSGFIGQNFFGEGDDWVATVVGTSPTGNSLQVTKKQDGVGYQLNWRDGGSMPAHLTGWYTTFDKAEVAARVHLHELWEKARKAG